MSPSSTSIIRQATNKKESDPPTQEVEKAGRHRRAHSLSSLFSPGTPRSVQSSRGRVRGEGSQGGCRWRRGGTARCGHTPPPRLTRGSTSRRPGTAPWRKCRRSSSPPRLLACRKGTPTSRKHGSACEGARAVARRLRRLVLGRFFLRARAVEYRRDIVFLENMHTEDMYNQVCGKVFRGMFGDVPSCIAQVA